MTLEDVLSFVEESSLNLGDDDRFSRSVLETLSVLNLQNIDLAEDLSVSAKTVGLWKEGAVFPSELMRKPVYKVLLRKLRNRVKLREMRRKVKEWTDREKVEIPYPSSRYDEVFEKGVKWLDSQDSPQVKTRDLPYDEILVSVNLGKGEVYCRVYGATNFSEDEEQNRTELISLLREIASHLEKE